MKNATRRDYYRLYKFLRYHRPYTSDIDTRIDLIRIKNWLADCLTADKYGEELPELFTGILEG